MSTLLPFLRGFLAVALLFSPAALFGQDQPQQDKKDDKPVAAPKEQIFKGTLTGLQQVVSHILILKKDLNFTFTVDSPGFMTSVRLENGRGQSLNSFTGSNIFKAPEDGIYRVLVSSPGGSSGQYVLSVRPTHISPSKEGEALTVGKDGLIVEAVLTKEDPLDKVRKKHCRIYDVKMESGKTYVIDLSSRQFDAFLRLENSEGKQLAKDDDSGGGQNARIRFKAPSEGVYRVYATSFGLETGLFLLKIREE